jgi:hypothetical protein
MTREEFQALLGRIHGAWPNVKIDRPTAAAWADRLLPVDGGDAKDAYDLLLNKGSSFMPSLAEFMVAIAEVQQGPPPTAMEMDRIINRNASRWPYPGHAPNDQRTIAAIEQLASIGTHEAVLRFVGQIGAHAAGQMPDGSRYALDRDQEIRQAQLFKVYREEAVASWRADPTPGKALAAAREQLELAAGGAGHRTDAQAAGGGRAMKRLLLWSPQVVMFGLLIVGAVTDDETWSIAGLVFGAGACLEWAVAVWAFRGGVR